MVLAPGEEMVAEENRLPPLKVGETGNERPTVALDSIEENGEEVHQTRVERAELPSHP